MTPEFAEIVYSATYAARPPLSMALGKEFLMPASGNRLEYLFANFRVRNGFAGMTSEPGVIHEERVTKEFPEEREPGGPGGRRWFVVRKICGGPEQRGHPHRD